MTIQAGSFTICDVLWVYLNKRQKNVFLVDSYVLQKLFTKSPVSETFWANKDSRLLVVFITSNKDGECFVEPSTACYVPLKVCSDMIVG